MIKPVKKTVKNKKPVAGQGAGGARQFDEAMTKKSYESVGFTPTTPAASTSNPSLGGMDMNTVRALIGSFAGGAGGGGGGSSRAAEMQLERQKLAEQRRQFNREMGFQREQYAGQQASAQQEIARKQSAMDDYLSRVQGMIDAGPTNTALYDILANLSKSAQGTIGGAYDQLAASLGQIKNPFEGYQAEAVSSPTAGLEQFLSSQGVGTDDLTRFAQLQQAQSQAQATAANNLMAQLAGIYGGSQQSRLAEAQMGRTADLGNVGLNEMLMRAQLGQQGQSQMDALRQLLLQGQMQRASF